MENSPSLARSLVGLVSRPGGTASRRPPALPAMTLLTFPVSGPSGQLSNGGRSAASGMTSGMTSLARQVSAASAARMSAGSARMV